MGTSKSLRSGQSGNTPNNPTWKKDETTTNIQEGSNKPSNESNSKKLPPVEKQLDKDRFKDARNYFSRYISSGGSNNKLLKNALNYYVSRSCGGKKNSIARMGTSVKTGKIILSFLREVSNTGLEKTLDKFDLNDYKDKPFEEIIRAFSEKISPNDSDIDSSTNREVIFETIPELAQKGLLDIDRLNEIEVIKEIFLIHTTNSIVARIIKDIGNKYQQYSKSFNISKKIINNFKKFTCRFIRDAIGHKFNNFYSSTNKDLNSCINGIYGDVFEIFESNWSD